MKRGQQLGALLAIAIANSLMVCAEAQVNEGRPIRLVVPTLPGGGIDTYGRLLAKELSPMLGVITVENRAGGSTNIGANYVAKSPPDGQTILITVNTYSINAAVFKSLPFDPLKDLLPVTLLGGQPFVIAVNSSIPVRNLTELVALSKKPKSKFSYTSCGNGTAQHLGGELFKSLTGADMVHVPYKGCAPAIADVASGQAPVAVSPVSTAVPFVKSGKVRALAMTTNKRSPLLPGVPSSSESGLSNYNVDQWFGLMVPAGTPREIINRLNASVAKVLANDKFLKVLVAQGIQPAHSTPEEFGQVIRDDIDRWGRLARAINLQLD